MTHDHMDSMAKALHTHDVHWEIPDSVRESVVFQRISALDSQPFKLVNGVVTFP